MSARSAPRVRSVKWTSRWRCAFETLAGLVGMGTRGDLGDAQRDFLKARGRCGANNACLTALYQARIATLKSEYQGLKSRGPF